MKHIENKRLDRVRQIQIKFILYLQNIFSPCLTEADEGISATDTKKRDGFKQMIADALAGKINLIITKSVGRFARNTVDSLTTVRKLKEKGIEVYFEKKDFYTAKTLENAAVTALSRVSWCLGGV